MQGVVRSPIRLACCVALAMCLHADHDACASSSLRVWGEPSEFMTGGATLGFDSTSVFTFSQTLGGLACNVGSPTWSIRFRGPTTHPLAPGTYGPLISSPSDNEPMIDEGYRTSGCRPTSGSFQVRKLAFAPNGAVRQAWITWTAKCTATAPSQFGELRVDADTTIWQALPADSWCFGGDSAAFDVHAFDAGDRPVTFQVSGLPAGATFTDLGGGTAKFRWQTAVTGAAQVVPVTVIASDDLGASDTSMTRVHVVPYSMLTVSSDPGDPLGGGHPSAFLGPEAVAQLDEHQANLGLQVTWLNQGQRWRFSLVAPFSRKLEAGAYEGALRAAFQPTMLPGLDVTAGTACNTETGRFTVRRLARNAQGAVTGIWATVEDHCDGITPKVLAEMRYNIDTTLYVQAPADMNVEQGTPMSFAVAAVGTRGRPLTLGVSGLPPGATFTPIGTDAGSVSWVAPAAPTGETDVTFAATDDLGGRAEVTTRIHVTAPSRFILRSTANDCGRPSQTLVLTQLNFDFVPFPRETTEAWVDVRGAISGRLNVRAPFGFALRKGTYPVGSYEYTGADRIYGYMTYNIDSFGYTNTPGTFHVRKLRIDANGFARSLWATWQSGCIGPATTTGELILNADTSLYLSAPAIAMVERGRALQFDVSGTSATGAPVALACPQSPAGATFTLGSAGHATLSWTAAMPAGNAVATFIGSDPAGNADTLTTLIRVMKPQLMAVNADPGYWTTIGGPSRLDATNSNFYAPNPGVVDLLCYAIGRTWEFQASAPFDRRLTPGLYQGGPRWAAGQPSRLATLRVISGNNNTAGDSVSFHVRKIGFGSDGRLAQLWMPFNINEGSRHITGELRFGDPDTTLYLSAPADLYANPASPMTYTVRAVHAQNRPVTLSARGVPANASFSDQGDGTGTFVWPVGSSGNATIPVTVTASDDQGRQDTCVTYLHVVVPASLQTVRDPNDGTDSWARSSSTDATLSDFALHPYQAHGVSLEVQSIGLDWQFYFDAPHDDFFTRRTYAGALGTYDPTQPQMTILSNGSGCFFSGSRGTFTVLDASYDATGHIATFAATFKDSCSLRGALSGELHYGISTGVVATLASRLLASGENGMARLGWRVTSTGGTLRLERREGNGGEWRLLATPAPDGVGNLSYEDRQVVPGETYDYRLSSGAGTVLDEVAVTITAATGFRILSVGPNPANRTLIVHTSGPSAGSLRLSVVDIAGRVVWSELRRAETAEGSTLNLQLPGSLASGVYVLRVVWPSSSAERRFAVVQ